MRIGLLRAVAIVFAVLGAGSLDTGALRAAGPGAESETLTKPALVRELQRALRDDDRAWLSRRIHYPLRYHGQTLAVIRNRNDFLRGYDALISDRLRTAILTQDPDSVFENWQGMMVGDGAHNVWLRESGEGAATRYEIVTINDGK